MLFYNIKGNIIQTSVNGSSVNFEIDETNQGSIEHVELMKDDYIELHFNSKTPIYFPIGTYCNYNSKLYYVLDKQKPSVTTTGLEYKLKLESYYMKWKNILCMYNKANGGEASWTLAGNITMFGNVIVHILADEGIKYNGSDIIFTIDSTVTADINTIEFSSVSVIEALNMIAEKFECEWWVIDNVIHFGKCELGTEYVKLEVGEELASNSPSNSDSKFANRIYAFGSDKNIPVTYRKHLIFTCDTIGTRNGKTTIFDSTRPIKTTYFAGAPNSSVIVQTSIKFLTGAYAGNTYNVTVNPDAVLNGGLIMLDASITPSTTDTYSIPNILPSQVPVSYYTADNDYVKNSVVQNRLALPSSKPYVGIEDLGDVSNLDIDENDDIVPAIVTFDKEYPKLTSTVQSVSVQMINYKDSDGNILDEKYPQYTVVLNQPTDFDKKYVIGTLRCAFQSGLLAGSEYELQFNSGTSFTIVNNSDYGRQLPDLNLLPKAGDTLIMYNYDTQYFLSTSISDAELHLKQTTIDYIKKLLIDPTTYTSKRSVNNDTQLALGTKVNLIDPEHIQSKTIDGVVYGRKSRIYGYEKALDGSSLTYTVGESTIYSRLNSLESKVDSIEYNGASYQYAGSGNGTSVYLITSNDTTVPSDSNVFSAQRSKKEFLSKTQADRTDYDMIFGKNIEVDGQAILNDVVANTGTFAGLLKAAAATITGALLASTVSATTMNATTFIGELQGNAATATKLKTPRTIWGQSFDGSGNVEGTFNLSGSYRDKLTIEDATTYRLIQTWDNVPLSLNPLGNNVGIGLTSPSYMLDVAGVINSSATIRSTIGFVIPGALVINTQSTYALVNSLGRNLCFNPTVYNIGIGTTSPLYKLDVNGNARISSDLYTDATVGTRNFASHTVGWNVNANGAADFRSIYADELRVQAFTADISQVLAGSDYLTKSVSKLSANFIVPSVGNTVRIIVDDIEGMPATQCFSNGDYIRFRAFNRTSGLTIANVWGTVSLDTSFGTNGFLNGTQAYTFTCKQTTGAGLTVFKGSEVLDYGTSGSGLIARTTLDAQGSPYTQIATWVSDPSVSTNYTVHARLGNLGGIANCNGYGLYTDNGFFTGEIIIGDLTKTANFLSFDAVNGLQVKIGGTSVATTTDVNNSLTTANTNAQGYANTAQTTAINTAATNASALYVTQTAYSSQVTILQNSINAKVSQTDFNALGTRVGTAESTITQHSTDIASKVSQTDYTGNTIASLINQTATTVAINASKINLVGAVTFSTFSSDLQTSFNDKASVSSVTTAQSDATAALTRNNTMAVKLGYTDYTALASAAALGHTLIDGGFINTQLIQATAVVTNGLTANCITANMISSGAVTADKIYSGAVTTDKLDAGAVTATTIAAGAVTTDKLYVGAVTADKIAANTITGDKINATSVSASIATVISLDASRITTGTLSADRIDSVSVVANGIAAQTINAQNATFENLNVTSATMYNGTIYNLRSPWEVTVDAFEYLETDNAIMRGAVSLLGNTLYTLPWTNNDIGRFIRLADTNGVENNSRYGSSFINAPDGKYFYINGNQVTTLKLNRQIAELIGIGVDGVFKGWAVLNVKGLMETSQSGAPLNVLAQGYVTISSSDITNPTITYKMLNGGHLNGSEYTLIVSRLNTGLYRIAFPTGWNIGTDYIVMLTGLGYSASDNTSPVSATLKAKNSGYFDIITSNLTAIADGSFQFQLFSLTNM